MTTFKKKYKPGQAFKCKQPIDGRILSFIISDLDQESNYYTVNILCDKQGLFIGCLYEDQIDYWYELDCVQKIREMFQHEP